MEHNIIKKRIFCLGGLPRAGSTILANLLSQNSRFHATHTSGCLDTIIGIRNQWHKITEHLAHPNDTALKNVMVATLHAYYQDVNKEVIFDKSRGWTFYIDLIENLIGEKAKLLVPIRSIPDIMASIEKLHRKTSAIRQPPGEADYPLPCETLAGRCDMWSQQTSFFGKAYSRIMNCIQSGYRDRMHFIHFEELTSNPEKTMREIYEFLGEKYYKHDFDHVEQVTQESDDIHGYINLHDIRPKIEPVESCARQVLGDELYFKYKAFDFIL